MVQPASWSCAWLPAAPGRCSFSRCSSVAPATGDAPVPLAIVTEVGEWKQPPAVTELVDLGDADGRRAEALLYQSLRSDDPAAPHGERDGTREPRRSGTSGRSTASSRHSRRRARIPSAWQASSTGSRRGRARASRRSSAIRIPWSAPTRRGCSPATRRSRSNTSPACTSGPFAERPRGRARDTASRGSPAALRHALRLLEDPTSAGARAGLQDRRGRLGTRVGDLSRPAPRGHVVVGPRGRARGARRGR